MSGNPNALVYDDDAAIAARIKVIQSHEADFPMYGPDNTADAAASDQYHREAAPFVARLGDLLDKG